MRRLHARFFSALVVITLDVLVIWALTVGILRGTYAGRCMYAIGGNEEASRLSGINVSRQKLLIYTLSGLFAGIAGVLLTARLASASPQAGFTYELDAIAAVVIGGASLSGGVGSASGTLIGALILGVLRNGLNLLNVSAFWQQVVIGAVIALAVMTIRIATGIVTGRGVLGDRQVSRYWYLIPLRDLWGFAIWLAGVSGDTVEWRGKNLRLSPDGKIL